MTKSKNKSRILKRWLHSLDTRTRHKQYHPLLEKKACKQFLIKVPSLNSANGAKKQHTVKGK